ncbi:MAG: NAD-binding protein [Armatimonadetes bacterium]|nr:NAD-binding protein [Armatimonadota bacterium]
MYVVLVGGGKVGYYLTRTLLSEGHEVLLIEERSDRAGRITEELGGVVLVGDGCETTVLEEAGVSRADVVAAVTGHDEDNLVVCQVAKSRFKVPRTIARINNPKNKDIFQRLGIDNAISSTEVIYHMIEQQIPTGDVIPLAALRKGDIEIIEADLVDHSPVTGKTLDSIDLPPESVIISVLRGEQVLLPTGETELLSGDTVIALVKAVREDEFRKVFSETPWI